MAQNPADYKVFYEQFSKNLKLGVHDHENAQNRPKLAELLRYYSSSGGDEMTSLKDYVTRMKEGQKNIYYVSGESKSAIERSPFTEACIKKGFEVLFMTDPMDEYAMQQLRDYEDKKFVCLSKEGFKLEETDDEKKKREEERAQFADVCKFFKSTLGDKVEKVILSTRLTTSPCVLVTGEFGWSANMERIMRAQALRDNSTSTYMISKKTMEINPEHAIVKALKDRIAKDSTDQTTRDLVLMLFDTALLTSGFAVEDPISYSNRIHRMIKLAITDAEEEEEVVPPSASAAAAAAAGGSAMEDVD